MGNFDFLFSNNNKQTIITIIKNIIYTSKDAYFREQTKKSEKKIIIENVKTIITRKLTIITRKAKKIKKI